MIEFTDRKEEINPIRNRFENLKKGELVILFGRRRVGKTELTSKFLSDIPAEQKAYLLMDEGTPADMLRSVSEDISTAWPEVRREFASWEAVFSFLAERAKERKTVVAIDEFQRMNSDPRAFSRFQKAWDMHLKDLPIMIIFLGSAVGAIDKIAINAKSPLFGRATARFRINPFGYQAFRQALNAKNEVDAVRLYSIFGGMPYYLDFAEKCVLSKDFLSVVAEDILHKNGRLRDEPQALLRMELKDTGRYNSILAAIAAGHRNPKEISDQTGIKQGPLVFYLNKLENSLNIIKKIKPLCGKHRPQYVFQDNFFAFWYKFVFRNLSTLEIEKYDFVRQKIETELPAVEGRVLEDILRELLVSYNGKMIKGVSISFTEIGSWWGRKDGDIDLVATSKNSLIVGECKWTEEQISSEVPATLEQRVAFLNCSDNQRSKVQFVIFSKNGFSSFAQRYMEERNMLGLTLKDLTALFDELPPK